MNTNNQTEQSQPQILIVDDKTTNLKVLGGMLEKSGYLVFAFHKLLKKKGKESFGKI